VKTVGYRAVLLVCLAIVQSPVLAQSPEDEEELALAFGDKATVSIATGHKQALRRAPAVASVITAEDIIAMGATDLDEVLETVPGIHVNRSANNYSPLYVVRGVFSLVTPQVLVMQNGIPLTTLFQGNKGNLWGGYPLEHVDRIEVIRGPGSALYGADAYSGVINIITKTAEDTPGTEIGIRTGSFRTNDTWFQHGGSLGPVDVAAYVRLGSTDGIRRNIEADAQSRLDRLTGTHASLAPGQIHAGYDAVDANLDFGYTQWRLRAGYKLRDNMETGAGIASALDPLSQQKSERITADLSWLEPQLTERWGMGFTASYLYYSQQIPIGYQLFPAGSRVGGPVSSNGFLGGPETWERQFRLSAFASYSGFSGHALRLGLGHDDLDLYKTHETRNFNYSASGALIPTTDGAVIDTTQTTPFMRPHRRMVDYFYVQDEWNVAKDWALTAGLRHDHYSDFGDTTNPRLALVWDAALDITAKLLFGRAFRAPSFNEVYGINNPVAQGNPNLRPETVSTVESAFTWQARRDIQFNLSLFRYVMKDTIRNVANPIANTGSTYANTGGQHGYGCELEAVWEFARDLRLSGNYSWQRSTDESTGADAGYAPHHQIYSRLDWDFSGDWQASSQLNWVAERKRAAGDNRPDIPDYTTLDLTMRTTNRSQPWGLAISVRNLFNADVREPSLAPGTAIPNDLPMAPRTAYIQLSYRL